MQSNQLQKTNLYQLLKLALPLMLSGFIFSTMGFFQTIFLAHLGQHILAAGALVNWMFGTLVVVMFGTLGSINVLVSHKYGAKDDEGISFVLRDGIMLAFILSIPAFILFWNMAPILLLFKQDHAIVMLAQSYLHALAWGLLPDFVVIAFVEFITGLGHMRVVTVFSSVMVAVNIFLSYVLIFGKFGIPKFGIVGAGLGLTITNWVMAIVIISYVLLHQHYKKYFRYMFHAKKQSYLWELFKVGFPLGAMYSIEVGFFFTLILLMGAFNVQMLAATQVAFQYMGIFTSFIFSIAQATTVRMGHLLGAKNAVAARHTAYIGLYISLVFMLFIALFYWLCPSILIGVDFNVHAPNNFSLVRDIEKILVFCAIFQIFESMRISLFGALRALKDTHFTFIVSVISFWCIALPLGYLFASYFNVGGIGLWWGMAIGPIVAVCLLLKRFQSKILHWQF